MANAEEDALRRLGTERVRRFCEQLAPELLTGLAAKLALGVGVAAAGVGGAGAAGVLPGPVQDVVSTAVSAVTPFDLSTDDKMKDAKDATDGLDDLENDDGDDTGGKPGLDTNPKNDFGKAVSADARGESDGVRGVDGQAVSEVARNKNDDKPNGGSSTGRNDAKKTPASSQGQNSRPGSGNGKAGTDSGNSGNSGKAPAGRP